VDKESAKELPADKIVEIKRNRDVVYCPTCGSDRMYRLERSGRIQKWVDPILGFYPWQCKACGAEAMLRKRHRRRRVHSTV
jgi:predicted RNA-binding Zn-ribbon protein involved in translation (DUF1610 family)